MPGREIAIPEGRVVSAPETPLPGARTGSRREEQATAGPIPVKVIGASVEVTAVVNPRTPAAYAVISGDKADEVTIGWSGGTWTLEWPEDAGGYGSTHISFGGVQANSFGRGGSVYVNGVRVDNLGGAAAREQPKVHLILPSGCSLYADLQSGGVYVPATADPKHGLSLVSLTSQSGGLEADCAVGQVVVSSQSGGVTANGFTGPVQVNTMSGSIDLAHAMGTVQAKTMSGGVHVHCEDSIMVSASSMSGSVRVTAVEGVTPTGSGSSMSGSVSLPSSMSGGRQRHSW